MLVGEPRHGPRIRLVALRRDAHTSWTGHHAGGAPTSAETCLLHLIGYGLARSSARSIITALNVEVSSVTTILYLQVSPPSM